MSDERTGFYWVEVLEQAKKNDRPVLIALKSNVDFEYEGQVITVGTGLVTLSNADEDDELYTHVLLSEIVSVGVMKGHDD